MFEPHHGGRHRLERRHKHGTRDSAQPASIWHGISKITSIEGETWRTHLATGCLAGLGVRARNGGRS